MRVLNFSFFLKLERIVIYGMFVLVITFFSPSCLGHEIAKEPSGLQIKLQPVYHTRWSLRTVSLIAKRQAGKL